MENCWIGRATNCCYMSCHPLRFDKARYFVPHAYFQDFEQEVQYNTFKFVG